MEGSCTPSAHPSCKSDLSHILTEVESKIARHHRQELVFNVAFLTRGRPQGRRIWSSSGPGEIGKTWSGEEYDEAPTEEKKKKMASPRQEHCARDRQIFLKPDIVKRMTSNQNETDETKHPIALSQARSIELLNSLARIG
jgi:hypothetical protein